MDLLLQNKYNIIDRKGINKNKSIFIFNIIKIFQLIGSGLRHAQIHQHTLVLKIG